MFAILRSGGKQYKVKAGDVLRVEKLEKEIGDEFVITDVLFIGSDGKNYVGSPILDKASVSVVVKDQARAPKIIVLKKKRRQGYRKLQGHRQSFTQLVVKSIHSPDGDVSEAKVDLKATPKKETPTKKVVKTAKAAGDKETLTKKAVAKKVTKKVAKKATAAKTTTKKKTVTKKAVAKKATAKKTTKKKTATKAD